ncbi:MAG TPA: hypothetical protein VML95_10795 [Longimicrobiales bacterium]|nr:hypothetical protein [Longimicrobiales bacterium]
MSFANIAPGTGPFFVMAAPSFWALRGFGQEPGLTGVFLHEFAHTRQVGGFAGTLGPIDDTWPFPEELTDDAVQTRFGADSGYVATYLAERDLLYRAAEADSPDEVRTLAAEALSMIRRRHARWFVGDDAVFATLDDMFLSLGGGLGPRGGGGLRRGRPGVPLHGRRPVAGAGDDRAGPAEPGGGGGDGAIRSLRAPGPGTNDGALGLATSLTCLRGSTASSSPVATGASIRVALAP